MQISVSGMMFNQERQCGVRCRDLGPMISMSFSPTESYNGVLKKAVQCFFPKTTDCKFYLGDAQGSKILDTIDGKEWTLSEYLHKHGLFPSKTKFYCVQVKLIMHLSM